MMIIIIEFLILLMIFVNSYVQFWIRSDPDPSSRITDPDPTKSFGSWAKPLLKIPLHALYDDIKKYFQNLVRLSF
jgi:hypothetical protein